MIDIEKNLIAQQFQVSLPESAEKTKAIKPLTLAKSAHNFTR